MKRWGIHDGRSGRALAQERRAGAHRHHRRRCQPAGRLPRDLCHHDLHQCERDDRPRLRAQEGVPQEQRRPAHQRHGDLSRRAAAGARGQSRRGGGESLRGRRRGGGRGGQAVRKGCDLRRRLRGRLLYLGEPGPRLRRRRRLRDPHHPPQPARDRRHAPVDQHDGHRGQLSLPRGARGRAHASRGLLLHVLFQGVPQRHGQREVRLCAALRPLRLDHRHGRLCERD